MDILIIISETSFQEPSKINYLLIKFLLKSDAKKATASVPRKKKIRAIL